MSRSKRPPPPKPPRPVIIERELTPTGQRMPRPISMIPIPDPEVEFALPEFPSERPTGRRNTNVSTMHLLIGVYDELDLHNRELLVAIAHDILQRQNKPL